MLFFRSEEHVGRWCDAWKLPHGEVLPLDQAWRLARLWYDADRRDPSWRRRTAAEARDALEGIGLSGPFWRLD